MVLANRKKILTRFCSVFKWLKNGRITLDRYIYKQLWFSIYKSWYHSMNVWGWVNYEMCVPTLRLVFKTNTQCYLRMEYWRNWWHECTYEFLSTFDAEERESRASIYALPFPRISIHKYCFSFFQVQHPVDQRVGDVRGHFGDSVHPGQGPDPEHVDHRSLLAHGHLPELGRWPRDRGKIPIPQLHR